MQIHWRREDGKALCARVPFPRLTDNPKLVTCKYCLAKLGRNF